MKRRYQIDQQRAVQQFRQLAREENPNIQMIFPMAEVVGLLQEGVGHLLREAGLSLMNLVMEEEVRHWAGERHQQHPEGGPVLLVHLKSEGCPSKLRLGGGVRRSVTRLQTSGQLTLMAHISGG
jgi:hypothetical protein